MSGYGELAFFPQAFFKTERLEQTISEYFYFMSMFFPNILFCYKVLILKGLIFSRRFKGKPEDLLIYDKAWIFRNCFL